MILFHGTNTDIENIDLTRGLRHKDFGKGFYLTPERTTAIRMAQKKPLNFFIKPKLKLYEPTLSSSNSHLSDQLRFE